MVVKLLTELTQDSRLHAIFWLLLRLNIPRCLTLTSGVCLLSSLLRSWVDPMSRGEPVAPMPLLALTLSLMADCPMLPRAALT